MRIAIQGEPGSFSHEAALKMEPEATIVPCSLSSEVFRRVVEGHVDAAVIPIENSLAGPVVEHYDLLLAHDVTIEREALLRIRHNLIAMPGSSIEEIRRVSSHPVALAQCRHFLEQHQHMEVFPFYDTAGSVKQLMEQRETHAAGIASQIAATYYGAAVLAADIEDNPQNFTRFFFVRPTAKVQPDPKANKVSLAFSVANRPGTLVQALQVFSAHGTNLTKIESRPVPGQPWHYVFYVDYQITAPGDTRVPMEELLHHCSMVKELGSYRHSEQPA
ncbi:MAG TPA: prephenate dehydratase [Acidisarcina sp.]|nr:prephenate dehydratase [Acidisarcina sp.]